MTGFTYMREAFGGVWVNDQDRHFIASLGHGGFDDLHRGQVRLVRV